MKKILFMFLSLSMILSMLTFPSAVSAQSTTLYLSDLEWTSQSCGASNDFPSGTQKNAAIDGSDMVLVKDGNAYTFTKGLGAHAPSRITYDISSLNATHFSAYVGVDECTTKDYHSGREGIIANFIVKVDQQVIAQSGQMNPTMNAYHIDVDIPAGSSELTLIAEEGDNTWSDWIIWGEPILTVEEKEAPEIERVNTEMVYGNHIAMKIEDSILKLYREKDEGNTLIAQCSNFGSVKVNGRLVSDFFISEAEVLKDLNYEPFNLVNAISITLKSQSTNLQKRIEYILIPEIDGAICADTRFYNPDGYQLTEAKEHEFTLVDPDPNRIWSYNGGGEGSQSYYDTLQRVNNSFYRANKQDETSAGIPVADIYSIHGGVTIGDASLYREFLTTPVKGGNNTGSVSIVWNEVDTDTTNWAYGGKAIIAVHENDYYNGLKTYGDMMAKLGFEEPKNIPASSYDLRWESWGWEGAWTIDKILGKLDELYTNGIRQITLDDCWYTSAGDWQLNPDKFPNGINDMKRLTDAIHQKGMTIVLWWRPMDGGRDQAFSVLAGFTQQPSQLLKEHPEYFVKNVDGSFAKLSGPGASNTFNGSTGYALCPYSEGAIQSQVDFIDRAMNEWGIDGFKSDYVWGMPKCYNELHQHESPQDSTKYASNIFYQAIYEAIMKNDPNGFHLLCNCGTPQDYYSFPYVTQIPTADPTSVSQTRRRVKAYKALTNDNFPVTTDHNELWYPSTIGTGGLLIEKRDFTNQAQEDEYYRWLSIASEHQLHKGTHIGNLYAYGIDPYETYVVKQSDMMYYAFYNDGIYQTSGNPSITLKGLDANKYYRIEDYVNNRIIAECIAGSAPILQTNVEQYLLVRAVETNAPEMTLEPLSEKIKEAKEIDGRIYTSESYSALQIAIQEAEAALSSVSTYNEMMQATNALSQAITALIIKPVNANYLINKAAGEVTVESYSSQCGGTGEPTENGTGQAAATVDYNNDTYWHSNWQSNNGEKHTITYNLGKEYTLNDVTFLPRQAGRNGDIHKFEVYVGNSTDYTQNTLTGEYVFATNGTLNPSEWYRANIALNGTYKGQYVTIRITGSYGDSGDNQFASMAEIRFYGVEPADKTALGNAMNTAEDMLAEASKYEDASVAKLQTAYNAAQNVYDDETATQELVDTTKANLEAAMDGMVEKLTAPNKVDNVVATDTDYKTITLTWDASEKATEYDVYRKSYKEDAVFEFVDTVSETTYESVGVMTGKTYSFYVVAKNAAGEAQASETVEAATTLQGEVNLAIEQVSTAKFKLSWNKVDGATRYIVYRKRNDDKMLKVLTLGAEATEYVTAEMPNGNYTFQVRAGRYDSKDRVMTAASNKVNGSVEALKPSVTVKAGTKSAKVSWKKMEGVTHYIVYRATSGKYTKLITTKELSYTAKSLTSGKKYYFKVRGYKTYKSGTDLKYTVYTPYSSAKSVTAK